jgi:hypothetical protein
MNAGISLRPAVTMRVTVVRFVIAASEGRRRVHLAAGR